MVEIKTDFLSQLRSVTSEFHKSVEGLPISAVMVSNTVKISDYATYLNHMHAIISSTENNLFGILTAVIPDIESRRKVSLIEKDLYSINCSIKEKNTLFNDNYSVGFALGINYVVEGSSLGGRFLMKNINAVLKDKAATNYFAGYGQHTGSSWKTFLSYLTDYVEREDCANETIDGAVYGFKAIYTQLDQAY